MWVCMNSFGLEQYVQHKKFLYSVALLAYGRKSIIHLGKMNKISIAYNKINNTKYLGGVAVVVVRHSYVDKKIKCKES